MIPAKIKYAAILSFLRRKLLAVLSNCFHNKHFRNSPKASKSKDDRKIIGKIGEDFAAAYLEKNGYKILQRNWTCKCGEIDIVAQEGEFLVFIEVKTRRNSFYAQERLLETITKRKLHKLRTLTRIYIRFRHGSKSMLRHRVDIVGIILDPTTLAPIYYKLIKGIGFC